MPTNKRKMNRKRWKKTKITSKRSNDRLGFNVPRCLKCAAVLSLTTLRIRHRGVFVLVWPRITGDKRYWANQLKHKDDGGWPRITGDKRYWTNQLKHEDNGGWSGITGDRRHWANQLKHEDDEVWPTIIGDKRYMGKPTETRRRRGFGQELLAIEDTGQTDV